MSEKEAAVVSFTPLKPKYSFIVKKNNALQYENSEYVSLFWCHFLPVFVSELNVHVRECVCVCVYVCVWVRVCVPPSKFILYIYTHVILYPLGSAGSICLGALPVQDNRAGKWCMAWQLPPSFFFLFFLFPVCTNGKTKKVNIRRKHLKNK